MTKGKLAKVAATCLHSNSSSIQQSTCQGNDAEFRPLHTPKSAQLITNVVARSRYNKCPSTSLILFRMVQDTLNYPRAIKSHILDGVNESTCSVKTIMARQREAFSPSSFAYSQSWYLTSCSISKKYGESRTALHGLRANSHLMKSARLIRCAAAQL